MRIGNQVNVGPLACVIGANHGMSADRPIQAQPHESLEVVIGDDVWIGAGSIVLPGSRIGRGAVIGAGSVVSGEVAEMTVAAGAPARRIRER
jgi:acetyltransferase-like isoleucine patch superfamily enzyme